MTMKLALYLLLTVIPSLSHACVLTWDYGDSAWIEGFRVYQDGTEVGTAAPGDRSGDCSILGLTPGPQPITMTAYRGPDESDQSAPAIFEIAAPGVVTVRVSFP